MNFKKNAFTFATIVAFGGFVFGLDAALISGTVNYLVQEFGLTDLQLGTVVSAPGLGVFIALPLAGWASNALGRKKNFANHCCPLFNFGSHFDHCAFFLDTNSCSLIRWFGF